MSEKSNRPGSPPILPGSGSTTPNEREEHPAACPACTSDGRCTGGEGCLVAESFGPDIIRTLDEPESPLGGYREVKCVCGAITALVPAGMEVTNLRCWTCPKDDPAPLAPVLRLVKS